MLQYCSIHLCHAVYVLTWRLKLAVPLLSINFEGMDDVS